MTLIWSWEKKLLSRDDNRTDEDQLGASYDELEWAMKQHESGKTPADFSDREKDVFTTYLKHHTMNKHKMLPIPICVIPHGPIALKLLATTLMGTLLLSLLTQSDSLYIATFPQIDGMISVV